MTKLLVVVPSRGRPGNVTRLRDAIRTTAELDPEIVVCLDEDDAPSYPRLDDVDYLVGPRLRLADWHNRVARARASHYSHFALFADDVVPETMGWDRILISEIEDFEFGVAYGDDGIQHDALPTHPIVSTSLAREFGWMALPGIVHLYLDNAWKALGEGTGTLRYRPDVMIRHLHRNLGLAPDDQTYQEANNNLVQLDADRRRFETWYASDDYREVVARLHALNAEARYRQGA